MHAGVVRQLKISANQAWQETIEYMVFIATGAERCGLSVSEWGWGNSLLPHPGTRSHWN